MDHVPYEEAGASMTMEFSPPLVVTEHWTDSRSAVVLSAPRPVLEAVARLVDLPPDAVISMRLDSATLGIWGEHLAAYQYLRQQGHITSRA